MATQRSNWANIGSGYASSGGGAQAVARKRLYSSSVIILLPSGPHIWGCGFGFADGHASIRNWMKPALKIPVSKGFRTSFVPATDGINDVDLQWLWQHAAAEVPPP